MSSSVIKEVVKKWYMLEDGKIIFIESLEGRVVIYRESPSMIQKVNLAPKIMNRIALPSSEEEFNRVVHLTWEDLETFYEFFDKYDLNYFEKLRGKYNGLKSFMNDFSKVDVQKVFEGKIKIVPTDK